MRPTEAQTRTLLDAAAAEARRIGKAMSLAVVDDSGYLVGLVRMDGARFMSSQIAEAKAFSAAAWNLSTATIGDRFRAKPEPFQAFMHIGRCKLVPGPGGLPIQLGGQLIGGIGASGGTGEEDEQCCAAALRALG